MIRQLSISSAQDIQEQGELRTAGNSESATAPVTIDAHKLLEEMRRQYQDQPIAKGRQIRISPERERVILENDPVLLRQVLGNLLKNALDASRENDQVLLGVDAREGTVEFWVRNSQPMDLDEESQQFQGSFSTKGRRRGLGSFAIFRLTIPNDFSR